ncbi:uncharacterized protein LOC130613611 [Hydractinia symbiolongicarpus]|uniref:uncharacterized protein LOC130613611 n=1 Tax=Hydractinia symbiolongicarpus TaxID=13093 RepID=UPI00254A9341|nr:uncharacterized protein LOC130613611 [Hydractinia symbiolongicarpus]
MAGINREVILALLLLDEEEEEDREEPPRNCWVQPWLGNRECLGAFHTIFNEIKNDEKKCRGYIRMNNAQFEYLVGLLSEDLQKQDTNMRNSITPAELVCVALRYLATGETFRSLEFQFRVSRKRISAAVMEVSEAIIKRLGPTFLSTPKTQGEWLDISRKFNERWNFPNGLGALDGKHIVIQQPPNSGSHYRNYKGTDSVVLMALVGPEYEFLYVEVGANGRNSDGGIWDQCNLKKALDSGSLNLPEVCNLPGRNNKVPYVITGDDAFPLKNYLMKPYPQKNLTVNKRIFNYRLSRKRRISENGFGILANRWRIFRRPINLEPEKVSTITMATVALHNWQRSKSSVGKIEVPIGLVDRENERGEIIEGAWREDTPTGTWFSLSNDIYGNRSSNQAKAIRDEFTEYFVMEGAVRWQWHCARVDI